MWRGMYLTLNIKTVQCYGFDPSHLPGQSKTVCLYMYMYVWFICQCDTLCWTARPAAFLHPHWRVVPPLCVFSSCSSPRRSTCWSLLQRNSAKSWRRSWSWAPLTSGATAGTMDTSPERWTHELHEQQNISHLFQCSSTVVQSAILSSLASDFQTIHQIIMLNRMFLFYFILFYLSVQTPRCLSRKMMSLQPWLNDSLKTLTVLMAKC